MGGSSMADLDSIKSRGSRSGCTEGRGTDVSVDTAAEADAPAGGGGDGGGGGGGGGGGNDGRGRQSPTSPQPSPPTSERQPSADSMSRNSAEWPKSLSVSGQL